MVAAASLPLERLTGALAATRQVLMTRFNALPPLPEETATARQERELARASGSDPHKPPRSHACARPQAPPTSPRC